MGSFAIELQLESIQGELEAIVELVFERIRGTVPRRKGQPCFGQHTTVNKGVNRGCR